MRLLAAHSRWPTCAWPNRWLFPAIALTVVASCGTDAALEPVSESDSDAEQQPALSIESPAEPETGTESEAGEAVAGDAAGTEDQAALETDVSLEGEVRWNTELPFDDGVILAKDEQIAVVGDRFDPVASQVVGVDLATGEIVWEDDRSIASAWPVLADGRAYYVSADRTIARDAGGAVIWETEGSSAIVATPEVVFLVEAVGDLRPRGVTAVDPQSGQMLWSLEGDVGLADVTLDTVLIYTVDAGYQAYDIDTGDALWAEVIQGEFGVAGPRPLSGGPRVFLLELGGELVAVEPRTGEPIWTQPTVDEVVGSFEFELLSDRDQVITCRVVSDVEISLLDATTGAVVTRVELPIRSSLLGVGQDVLVIGRGGQPRSCLYRPDDASHWVAEGFGIGDGVERWRVEAEDGRSFTTTSTRVPGQTGWELDVSLLVESDLESDLRAGETRRFIDVETGEPIEATGTHGALLRAGGYEIRSERVDGGDLVVTIEELDVELVVDDTEAPFAGTAVVEDGLLIVAGDQLFAIG